MNPEQDKKRYVVVVLPDGHRLEFHSNAAAWRWIDGHEGRSSGSAATGNGGNQRRHRNQPDDETGRGKWQN
jgi:hypothetical protein